LAGELKMAGMEGVHDYGGPELTARYLAGRRDGLELRGQCGRICVARVGR
jgi:hypothetical protein